MIFIAHRGNIKGENSERENSAVHILEAIDKGFDVEVDVCRIENNLIYLGHDGPYTWFEKDHLFQYNDKLWYHAKNIDVLYELLNMNCHCFYHGSDDYTLTSQGFIWTYPGADLTSKSVCVKPEDLPGWHDLIDYLDIESPYAVCSDYVASIRECLENRNK